MYGLVNKEVDDLVVTKRGHLFNECDHGRARDWRAVGVVMCREDNIRRALLSSRIDR